MSKRQELLPAGKLPHDLLGLILGRLSSHDPRVIVGPQIGEDAAVIETGDDCLVVSTDPITFAIHRIGWYAVHVNANDVAVMGARPRWFFAALLLPEACTPDLVDTVMADVTAACDELEVTLCGGHTEITPGLDRPIVIGQMLGEVAAERLVRKNRLQAGDRILLTRGVAIEGTAILARESDRLRGRLDAELLARAERLLVDPGISVVNAALAAAETGDAVHAMHDPTEGGLATGLFELVASSGLGVRVGREEIHVFPETEAIAAVLGLDALNLLASGALLIAAAPDGAASLIGVLHEKGIAVEDIGEVRPPGEGLTITAAGRATPLVVRNRDEIARALAPERSRVER